MRAATQPRDIRGRFIKEPKPVWGTDEWIAEVKATEMREAREDWLILKLITWSVITVILVYFSAHLGATGRLI